LTKPTLVLLHGMGTGPGAWGPQVEAFSPSRRVLSPHLQLDRGFSIESEAVRFWQLADSTPVDLCGLSLGALVALRAALDEPGRVRRLALCAGFAALSLPLRALQATLGAALGVVPARVLKRQVPALDRATIRTIFREGRKFDVTSELDRLTMPVLVLVGERDRANTRPSRALSDRLPAAELQVLPGAGHLANADAPEAFNEALRSFLDDAD
jgi:pimeloyl-ACP methyl ester carboxylesterase